MRARRLVLAIFLLAGTAVPQNANQVRYRPVLDNDKVTVLDLDLPPHTHAASYQNQHDVLWIGLNDASVTFVDSDRHETEVQFRPGDARFFRSFSTQQITNKSGGTFHGVLLVLKSRAPATASCGCSSAVERAVCGCGVTDALPKLWAVAVRNVTIAGTMLAAGESFPRAVPRGDTVLVAVTAVDLQDDEGVINLQPGEAQWMKAGAHRLKNVGNADARFVTVEF